MGRNPKLNERRKENYRRLRLAGFSNRDATKYKDRTPEVVERLIKACSTGKQLTESMILEALKC
jgi:transposase